MQVTGAAHREAAPLLQSRHFGAVHRPNARLRFSSASTVSSAANAIARSFSMFCDRIRYEAVELRLQLLLAEIFDFVSGDELRHGVFSLNLQAMTITALMK